MLETKIPHLFPNLPPEIRNQIWLFAIHLFPRVMEASLVPYSHIKGVAWIIHKTRIPALLSANSEPRSIARDSYSQIFKTDTWQPWIIRNFHHLVNNYEIDILFINMSNTRMEDGSVINTLTLVFGYDATMELERHLKSLAETWYFWSKILHPREIPF
jgi:hypothetical protein